MPTVWKSPGMVKLVFDPTVGGFRTSPWNDVLSIEALRSRSLVIDILLTAMDVALMKETAGGIGVPTGRLPRKYWKN